MLFKLYHTPTGVHNKNSAGLLTRHSAQPGGTYEVIHHHAISACGKHHSSYALVMNGWFCD